MLIVLLALLAGISTAFALMSRTANYNANYINQSRNYLMMSTYRFHAHTSDLTRFARIYATTGQARNYEMWHQLMDSNTFDNIISIVNLYTLPEEYMMFEQILDDFFRHRELDLRAFNLIAAGYREDAVLLLYSEEYISTGIPMQALAAELTALIDARTEAESIEAIRRANVYGILAFVALLFLALAAIWGIVFMVQKFSELIERNQFILDALPLSITLWDENHKIIDCNASNWRNLGLNSKKEYLENFASYMPTSQPDGTPSVEKATQNMNKLMLQGGTIEWFGTNAQGKPLPMEANCIPMDYNGRPVLLVYAIDLTEIRHRENLLNIVNKAATTLLAVEDKKNFQDAVLHCLELVGQCLDADRVQLWRAELNDDNSEMNLSLDTQWLSEIGQKTPQIDLNQKIYTGSLPNFEDAFLKGRSFNGLVSEMPDPERSFLLSNGTLKSTVIIPVYFNNTFWGLFTLDDCVNERTFSDNEMDILHSASLMIVSAFYRAEQANMREAKATEERERQFADRWKIINNASPIGVNFLNSNFQVIDSNETSYRRIFGFENKEDYIENMHLTLPELQPDGSKTMEKVYNDLQIVLEKGYYRSEWAVLNKKGQSIPLDVSAVRIKDHNDEVMLATYLQDLRPIKTALELKAKMEANEVIMLMSDKAPFCIEYWDRDYKPLYCNQSALNYYGFTTKQQYYDYTAKDYHKLDLKSSKYQNKWRQELENIFINGQGSFEYEDLKPNGEISILEVTGLSMQYNNKDIVFTYSQDITENKKIQEERKRIEIAEESSRAKSRFLARMSHEIRTPITAVLGIAEIELQSSNLSPHLEESFTKIFSSASTLLGIVNDILDLSKIEAGKVELLIESYDTASMISNISSLYVKLIGSKNIEFIINVDENIPAVLSGDMLRIIQIMNNLLSNAFKYTDAGSVTLSFRWDPSDLLITIRDTGLGMTKDQINNSFQDYSRFHEQKMPGTIGTGLGIPIVYSVIKMMGGTIDFESEVNKGTAVSVRLPQKQAGKKTLGKELAQRLQQFEVLYSANKKFKTTPEPMPYGSVLIVDDVDVNLYVARGLMAFYDLNIDICVSGFEAIEKIKQGNIYDIIFMDQMMPGLNGDQALKIIRDLGYTHPIVVLTANAMIGQSDDFIQLGFDGFISKPIQTAHLNSILNKHIRDKQPPEVIKAARAQAAAAVKNLENYQNSPDLIAKLRTDFGQSHKNVSTDIRQSLAKKDLKTAHRLAHTLKSSSALIKESTLSDTAQNLEGILAKNEHPTSELLTKLDNELAQVLKNIATPEKVPLKGKTEFDKHKATDLFDKLIPLLQTNNHDALSHIDELRNLPETAVLVKLIEEYEFKLAYGVVTKLRLILDV